MKIVKIANAKPKPKSNSNETKIIKLAMDCQNKTKKKLDVKSFSVFWQQTKK